MEPDRYHGRAMTPRHRPAAALLFLALAWGSRAAALDASEREPDARLAAGFELAYDLDCNAAVETFRQVIAKRRANREPGAAGTVAADAGE